MEAGNNTLQMIGFDKPDIYLPVFFLFLFENDLP